MWSVPFHIPLKFFNRAEDDRQQNQRPVLSSSTVLMDNGNLIRNKEYTTGVSQF